MLSLASTMMVLATSVPCACRSAQPLVHPARAVDGMVEGVEDGRRLKEKLTCGTHPSVSGGGEEQSGYFGPYENTIAFAYLRMGPMLSNT
jgi:hypothetical protein